eukprot:1637903-Pyramimonas_sp.AAC.2
MPSLPPQDIPRAAQALPKRTQGGPPEPHGLRSPQYPPCRHGRAPIEASRSPPRAVTVVSQQTPYRNPGGPCKHNPCTVQGEPTATRV